MTDNDIRDYIESCEEPLFMKDVLSELREDDPTVSFKRVARILREMGFENHCRKNTQNSAGRGSSWTRENAVETEQSEPVEAEKAEPKSTEQIIDEVEERNEQATSLNARLLESLKVSRDLKDEIMQRQREALVSMARQVLSLFGDTYEQQRYKP